VLEDSTIDVVLGMSWLRKAKAVHCAKGTVELTSSKGQRFEVEVAVTTTIGLVAFLVDEEFVGDNIRAVRDFFRMSFQGSYQGCHQIGKLSL
jgi:hypothetical protein